MTVSSWFRNDSKPPVKDLVKYLAPKASQQDRVFEDRSRFSQLLLEYGEKHLQDWAVVAYSNPVDRATVSDSAAPRQNDKIRWEQSPSGHRESRRSSATKIRRQQPKSAAGNVDPDSYPSARMVKIEGRLHLCSRSLVFEPRETSRGIVRCPFAKMEGAPKEYPSDPGFAAMCVECFLTRHLVMKAKNVVGPFESVQLSVCFRFTFLHSSPKSFVDLCQHLFQMAVGSGKQGPAHSASTELDSLLRPMLDRPFDSSNLVDIREQILVSSIRSYILTPLQSKPGVLTVTSERVYFQPAAGVLTSTDTRALRWNQRDMVATARRYKGLRDSALEIYWKDETSTLFAFERRHDREQVLRCLPTVSCLTDREFVVAAASEWQCGAISNYEYLLAINAAAGRSFHDLSRYPVFPWVIRDYESSSLDLNKESTFRDLSKPMGAMNDKRLDYFRQRLESMQDMEEPFLYGTHYSAPGYVLYYLVRSLPEHMLCLQNGKFDAPDRMFHGIDHCFKCALSNHADVKELIPEFYNAKNDFDFLINARGLQLGATQNGDRVDDVKLPPWARSARDFIKKNRKALESEICTRMLPRWIDLIFGDKSRGDAALQASNLFHRITYLGPRDLANMPSEEERFQAELQATEFGIVPDQLFQAPHPLRQDDASDDFISPDLGRASSKDDVGGAREAWELLDPPSSQSDLLPMDREPSYEVERGERLDEKAPLHLDPDLESSRSNPTTFNVHTTSTQPDFHVSAGDPARSLPLRGTGESHSGRGSFEGTDATASHQQGASHLESHDETSPKATQLAEPSASSDWDMKMIERKLIHSDAVSGCSLLLNNENSKGPLLVTTSLDGGLMVHTVSLEQTPQENVNRNSLSSTFSRFAYTNIISRGQASQGSNGTSQANKLYEYRSHSTRDPLASLVLAGDGAGGSVAFAGGHDDVVLAYGINSACAVASVYSHRDAVTGLDLIPRNASLDQESPLWLENSTHIMISGSWDATVKVWSSSVANGETVSISREPLAELFDADSSIVCVSARSIAANGGIAIAAGCADGSFCVWNVHNDGVQVVIHNEPARRGSGPCSVVRWVSTGGRLHLFAAFSTGRVASYTLVDGSLKKEAAVSVGVAILSLVVFEGVLLVGCSDGGLRLIPVRDGAHFDAKPTLWNAVNNTKSSPGVSSISIAVTGSSPNEPSRCICCTGGEDGSVALFELRRVTTLKGS